MQRYVTYMEGVGSLDSGVERRLGVGGDTGRGHECKQRQPSGEAAEKRVRPSRPLSLNTTVCRDVKMATVVSKTLISPSKMGFLSNIAPVAGYVAQRSYAIRPAEIPTAK